MEIKKRFKNAIAAFKETEKAETVEVEAEVNVISEPELGEDLNAEAEVDAAPTEDVEIGEDLNEVEVTEEEMVEVQTPTETEAVTENSNKRSFWVPIVALAVITLMIIVIAMSCERSAPEASNPAVDKEQVVVDDLALPENGSWEKGKDYEIVVDSDNPASAGKGSFTKDAVNSASKMVAWLKKESPAAKALIGFIADKTGASESQIMDPANWLAIKANHNFTYPGNTSFQDGKVTNSGDRAGVVGEVFLAFVNPDNGKIAYVRSACANPQGFTPYLEPKDASKDVLANDDVDDWKKNSNGEKAVADPEDLQTDPAADAAEAAKDAEAAADKAAADADAARDEAVDSGAGVVDSGTGYGEVEDPTTIDPNW